SEFGFARESNIIIFTHQHANIAKKKDKPALITLYFVVEGTVTAAHGVYDMHIALVATSKIFYVFSTTVKKREAMRGSANLSPIATEKIAGPIVHISVSDRQNADGERLVATMESTCIRLWGLTATSIVSRGSIDFTGSPLSTCALIYRCVEVTPAVEQGALRVEVLPGTPQLTAEQKVEGMIDNMFDTLDVHSCTERKNGRVVRRCPFTDCERVRLLAEHMDDCCEKANCTYAGCSVLYVWIMNNNDIPACVEHKYDRVEVDRTKRLCDTVTQLLAEVNKKKNKEKIDNRPSTRHVDTKMYDLLVVACESGEVKFIDPASYSTPTMQLLPTQPNDIVNSDIVAFCPAWTDHSRGRGLVDNLFGIYALTAQGQHVFRSFSGTDNKIVSTTLISNDVIDMASFVAHWGTTTVVAYGRKSIHLSAHRAEWKSRVSAHLLTSFAPILQCFAHSNHLVVCTKQRMVFICTWSLIHHEEMRGLTAKSIELEED
ncbi:hypothetical protein PFISCL1PPCAC_20771, partial [Pristionchus fissidentatus]